MKKKDLDCFLFFCEGSAYRQTDPLFGHKFGASALQTSGMAIDSTVAISGSAYPMEALCRLCLFKSEQFIRIQRNDETDQIKHKLVALIPMEVLVLFIRQTLFISTVNLLCLFFFLAKRIRMECIDYLPYVQRYNRKFL